MSGPALAIAVVLLAWWASTGLVLAVVWLGPSARRGSLVAASALGVGALGLLWWTAGLTSVAGVYGAFLAALVVWAWHELTFLLGAITGPRRAACPPGATGWRRFALGTQVVIHHELALAATVVLVGALTLHGPNPVGFFTFLVLWVMRLSAKLNVFLGVRNLAEDFIPPHLTYIRSYFRRARMNPLMPLSVVAPGAGVVALSVTLLEGGGTPAEAVGLALVATIMALAVLEHVFLMVPLPDAFLWRWATRLSRSPRPVPVPVETPP